MSDIIRLLPDSVANQIAAGEVIQRPASVIKELVENAVDAGATQITIVLKDAGRTLIQVIDNGSGMSDTDARMAFERHATSKIRDAADLFDLHTMGFRGEALASIAAVAQVDVRSMKHGASIGTRLVINGSDVESQTPEACQPGTNLMVKNLFFNVPVRRKFLKKDSVELSQIMREFERLALVNCDREFTLIHNDVTLHSLRKANFLQRITDLFGKNLDKQLIPINSDTSIVRLEGYIGLPEHARRRNALQYLTVNGRNMLHPYFRKAILSCYEQLIPADEQPNFFVNFIVDPDTIDVNIHPTKNEIKFENEQAIWQILAAAVRESLGRFNAGPAIDFEQEDVPDIPVFAPSASGTHDVDIDRTYNPFREDRPRQSASATNWEKLYENFNSKREAALNRETTGRIGSSLNLLNDTDDATATPKAANVQSELDLDFATTVPTVLQLKNRYILTPSRDGLLIVDQHRAHKRVLFERYIRATTGEPLASQRLIFPEMLQLSPAQSAIMEAIAPDAAKLGFDLSYIGDSAWSINAAPAALADANPRDLLMAMIDDVTSTGQDPETNIHERIALALAETAAVKSGQPLGNNEMDRITGELMKLPTPTYTPDGQRTFTLLTIENLNRMMG